MHSLLVGVFAFGALQLTEPELIEISLVFEEPEVKPEPEVDQSSLKPKPIPEEKPTRPKLETKEETPAPAKQATKQADRQTLAKKLDEAKAIPEPELEPGTIAKSKSEP